MSNILTSGTTGEVTPRLEGRIDLAKYYSAFRTLKNFYMYPHGPITFREGSYFVAEAKHRDKKCKLIPFKFNVEQNYMLEFGDYYIRVYMDGGAVVEDAVTITGASKAAECVITAVAHGYANGEEVYIDDIVGMTELNGKRYRVSDKAADTFKIKDLAGNYVDSSEYTAYVSDGSSYRIYEISTPYPEADLFGLQRTQSADIMYITYEDIPVYKLSRTGHTSWTIKAVDWTDGPYLPEQTVTHGITPSAVTGSVTLTAGTKNITGATQADPVVITSNGHGYANGDVVYITGVTGMTELNDQWYVVTNQAANTYELYDLDGNKVDGTGYTPYVNGGTSQEILFDSGDVNRLVRFLCTGNEYRWAKITAYTSGTQVTATIKGTDLPDANQVDTFRLGYWCEGNGYPSACTFHEQRFALAGSPSYPNTIWASMSGADSFEDFTPGTADADPVVFTLVAEQVNAVQWLASGLMLLAGCSDAEWVVKSNSLQEPLTPSNVNATTRSNRGSARVTPVRIDQTVLYVQLARRKLFEYGYKYTEEGDSYLSTDLTLLAEHITKSGIVDMAYQAEPNAIVWCVLDNGTLIGLTYQKEHDVVGWHQHETDGYVESVGVIPGTDQDQVWIVVKRTINSITRRYIEYLNPSEYEDDLADAFFVDSGLTYDGVATDNVTGLDHLEGETVTILADGCPHDTRTVSGGTLSEALDFEAEKIHIGLAYEGLAEYMRVAAAQQQSTVQGKRKRLVHLIVRLLNSLGGKTGPDTDNLDEIDYEWGDLGSATPLFSGDKQLRPPTGYEREGWFCIKQDQPLPLTIVAVMPEYDIGDV